NDDNKENIKDKNTEKLQKNNKSLPQNNTESDIQYNERITLRGGDLVEEALNEYESIINSEEKNKEEYKQQTQENSLKKEDKNLQLEGNFQNFDGNNIDKKQKTDEKNELMKSIQLELRYIFRTNVKIKEEGYNKGKIEIYFNNKEEFNRIIEYLGYGYSD
ncbi:MAG: hypothetical protein ACOCV8_03660, partial [Spirochaetota bacterium]